MAKTKKFDPKRLLDLLIRNKRREFGYRELYRMAQERFPELKKMSERNFIRYLNFLIRENLLEKRHDEKNRQRTHYRLVPREIVRNELSRRVELMRIDYTEQWSTILNFAESFPREVKETKPLKQLICIESGEYGTFPIGLANVTLFHNAERKGSKEAKELLDFIIKYKINLLVERMISEILSYVAVFIDGKDPSYIENTDELVEWYRDALNQELKIVVEFDGRHIVEQANWDQVKEKAKKGLEEWKRRNELMEKFRTTVEKPLIDRLVEELSKTPDDLLESVIEYAIGEMDRVFSSKDEAVQSVVRIVKDNKLASMLERVDLKRAVEDYLDNPESRYVLMHKRYHYPKSTRWYDQYLFVSRDILEFQEKMEDT